MRQGATWALAGWMGAAVLALTFSSQARAWTFEAGDSDDDSPEEVAVEVEGDADDPNDPGSSQGCDKPCQEALEQAGRELGFADPLGPFPLVSIAPYFSDDDPYHKARALMTRRRPDCKGALAHLARSGAACGATCEGRDAIDMARAEALWCAGQRQDAWEIIARLDTRGYPGMEREVRDLRRAWAKAMGKPVPASIKPTLAVDAERYLNHVTREAKQLARDGKVAQAVQLLRVVQRQARSESRVSKLARLEGKILQDAGRLEEAASVYRRLWRTDLRGGTGQAMLDRLDELEKAGLKGAGAGADARLERLVHLAARDQKRAARDLKEQFIARYELSAADQRALRDLLEAARLEEERKREEALVVVARVEKTAKHPALKARARFLKARALRRLDRDREAIDVYLSLADEFPGDLKAPEALYQAGRLHLYLGNHRQAGVVVSRLARDYPDCERLPDALWQAAWAEFLAGDAASALGHFETLAADHGKSRELSGLSLELKATYWKARSLAQLGRVDEAVATYGFVMTRWPLTYYAALAHHQIAGLGVDPASAVPFQPKLKAPLTLDGLRQLGQQDRVPAHPRVRRGLELWRTGRRDAAKQALWTQLQFKRPPRGAVELLATFHLLDDDVPASFWLARRYGDFSVAPYEGNQRLWGLAHPAPEGVLDVAREVGQDIDGDPFLALAIIRHESGFKSEVRSSVGARGLMQVMPASARVVNRMWYDGKGPSRVQDDADNIRLGMTMLRMLENYFDGNLPLMVGGYNAGSGIALRWHEQFKTLPTDALVEQMTYPRTVAYIKKVIGSHYAYRVLYGDGAVPEIPLAQPAELGDWLKSRRKGPDLVGMRLTPKAP